ncbi:class I SAM-dependent methyltransferase [Chloroflexota bacterium]
MSHHATPPQPGDPAYADLIRRDFDQLATFTTAGWDHNNHYHDFLLKQLPPHITNALDVGCGTGSFARRLAARADHVQGIDLSPVMIDLARQQAQQFPNITYQAADIMAANLQPTSFDCIASIATLHHLPLADALRCLRDLLRPGGTLLILDLYESATLADRLTEVAAVPVHWLLNRAKNTGQPAPPAVDSAAAAWDAHGDHDVYPTLAAVRQTCAAILPGACVRRHLLWRYSLVWTKIER